MPAGCEPGEQRQRPVQGAARERGRADDVEQHAHRPEQPAGLGHGHCRCPRRLVALAALARSFVRSCARVR
eukprot:2278024-Rhodomonas_salina.1